MGVFNLVNTAGLGFVDSYVLLRIKLFVDFSYRVALILARFSKFAAP